MSVQQGFIEGRRICKEPHQIAIQSNKLSNIHGDAIPLCYQWSIYLLINRATQEGIKYDT